MSAYRNIDINLLPPELQPPPTVRTAVILNAVLVLGVLAYIALGTFSAFNQVKNQQQLIKDNQKLIDSKQGVVTTYGDLMAVRETVDKYGRLVSLASVDYVDVPVLLDRLSRLIPAGVYLNSVANDKATPNATSSVVHIVLNTTQNDPKLMQATLDAFKKDSIFHDSYMSEAELKKVSLNDQFAKFKVDWAATGPDVPKSIDIDKYEFTVMANVSKLVDTTGLPVTSDKSVYLADVHFKTPPPEPQVDKNGKPIEAKPGDATAPREPEHGSANAPGGVKPVGVN